MKTQILLCAGSSLLAGSLTGCKNQASEKEQPLNVIYILAADWGYGDCGCYGQEKINTPHIYQMVAVGMKYTQQ